MITILRSSYTCQKFFSKVNIKIISYLQSFTGYPPRDSSMYGCTHYLNKCFPLAECEIVNNVPKLWIKRCIILVNLTSKVYQTLADPIIPRKYFIITQKKSFIG
jgi:hypothetical protein